MEQIISDIINNVINTIIVKELLNEKNYNNMWIFKYEKMIKELKNKNKNLEKEIYKTCNHNWEKDWDDLYSRYKVCKKCKLANFPYGYK